MRTVWVIMIVCGMTLTYACDGQRRRTSRVRTIVTNKLRIRERASGWATQALAQGCRRRRRNERERRKRRTEVEEGWIGPRDRGPAGRKRPPRGD